jgi:ABC-type nitrate/sulfonate/bicarbonate transport system substrate-binding protein
MKASGKLLMFSAVLLCSSGLRPQASAQTAKLRVAYTAFAGTFTVLWVGKDAGLYQKFSADMELLYIGSSTKSVQALLGGDIDIMYSAAGAVVDANLAGRAGDDRLPIRQRTNVILHHCCRHQHRRFEG